ncbi:hypothetical protein [Micromonospora zamorensis]|uniref:hypothetical protein n=1 Tax=Micromonospora zamorensis TaxID=709883 RepID=UPI0037A3415D
MSFDEVMRRATDTGDAHAIKFVDAVSDTHTRSGNPALLATAAQSVEQIATD